jgi:putative metalloenzyme radical SAM/SPASM domain maturase
MNLCLHCNERSKNYTERTRIWSYGAVIYRSDQANLGNGKMSDGLRRLNIEVTTRCNLNCSMCVRKVWREDSGDMSLQTYKALATVFPEIETINLIGIGEPLLNENIAEMIWLGKERLPANGTFSLTTNGTLIDKSMSSKLVSSGLNYIVVSIDGASPETFAGIRKGARLEDALSGIRFLNQAKEDVNSQTPVIGLEFVAMQRNIEELPQLVELAATHGISFIIVSNLLPHTEEMKNEILYDFNSEEAIELFEEAKAEARRRNIELTFDSLDVENYTNALFGVPPLKDKLRSGKPTWNNVRGYGKEMGQKFELLDETVAKARERNVCMSFKNLIPRDSSYIDHAHEIFIEAAARAKKLNIDLNLPPLIPMARRECGFIRDRIAFISWDGFVRPCHNLYHSYMCYVNGREKSINALSFGNVNERDLRDIWNSREYRSFRRQVDKFDFAPCGDCPHAEACFALLAPVFRKDCYEYTLPCGDCPWARGILKCM